MRIDRVARYSSSKGYQLPLSLRDPKKSTFYLSAIKEIRSHSGIVDRENCGTYSDLMRVGATITNARLNFWPFNMAAMAFHLAKGGVAPLPPFAPWGAREEIEVVDAMTVQTMVAFVIYHSNMPWQPVRFVLPCANVEQFCTKVGKSLAGHIGRDEPIAAMRPWLRISGSPFKAVH